MKELRTRVDSDSRKVVLSTYVKRFDAVFESMLSSLFREAFPFDRPCGWVMWTLGNGGFYLSPILPSGCLIMSKTGHCFTPDAAGIVACLCLFKRLSEHTEGYDRVMFDEFHAALIAWSRQHNEAYAIERFIA